MAGRAVWGWLLVGLSVSAAVADSDFVSASALDQAGLVKYWQFLLPLEKDQRIQRAYLVDDQLYLGTQDGYVFALHAPTGLLRWLRPVTLAAYPLRRPCHVGDRVIFVTPSDIQIYDRHTGQPIGRHDLRFPAGTAGASDGKRLFIGGMDQRLYAIDLDTMFLDWRAMTDGVLSSTPLIQGDNVVVASSAGSVFACSREDKTLRWQASTHGEISAEPVLGEDGIYVASRDFSLYLLDINFGRVRWRARLSGPLYDPPVLTSELVYQYSPSDGLVAIERRMDIPGDQRLRWKLSGGRWVLTVHEGQVLVLSADQRILAVRIEDGEVKASIPAAGFTIGVPAPDSATVLLVAADGRLFCARPRGVPPLQREDILAALRLPASAEPETATVAATTTSAGSDDRLATRQPGAPIGGKSRVSREFKPGVGSD